MRLLFLFFAFLVVIESEVRAEEIKFETSVKIVPCNQSVCLNVTTLNLSERAMYFPPWKRLIEIRSVRGEEVRDRGPIADFPLLELADYKKIIKGEKNEEIIDLGESFQFTKSGWYTLRVGSGYYDPENHKYYKKPISTIKFFFNCNNSQDTHLKKQ